MKIRFSLVVACLVVMSAIGVSAQKTTFTSTYTSLGGATCKFSRGGEGQDGFSLCKGPGGYQVRVYSSATMTHIVAELKGADDTFQLANVSLGFNQSKSKVEWRLANGKPFAAILRVPTYADPPDGAGGVGKKTGEELVVVGLKGHEGISTKIDAKTANANVKARENADSGYSAKK
jgi:hypothetical protein